MKKCIALLCILCVLITFSAPVHAEENALPEDTSNAAGETTFSEDSSRISEEILALLPVKSGDQVVRVYHLSLMSGFDLYGSMDELLNANDDLNYTYTTVYVIKSSDGTYQDYKIRDGVCFPSGSDSNYHKIMDTYLEGSVIYDIDPDIIVENAYYLVEIGYVRDDAIYYKTNLGDYVYLRTFEREEYLFSLEAFLEYEAAKREWTKERYANGGISGGAPYEPDMDLSAYQIGSPNFDPDAPFPVPKDNESHGTLWLIGGIALAVVLAAAATWFFLRRRHKAADRRI